MMPCKLRIKEDREKGNPASQPRESMRMSLGGTSSVARAVFCLAAWFWFFAPGNFAAQAGSAGAGTAFDLQGFIDRKIAAGKKRVVVPPGRYRVTPQHQQHLVLNGLKDIVILADGVEMICTETTRALTISHCTNVTVRGLVIDYDPLPFTQGRITGFGDGKKTAEIQLFDGYPDASSARNFKYEIFRPDTRTLRCEDRDVKKIEVIDARHIRVIYNYVPAGAPEQIGDIIAIGSEYAPHGNAAHAVVCGDNVNVRLENIGLFASNCFGFLEYNCNGSVYYRCRVDRRSPETDPVKRAAPRIRSLDADAFHSSGAVQGPAYLECAARFMGDDAVNIHGDYHIVMEAHDRELRVLAKDRMDIQPGDPVELVSYDGNRLPDARMVSIRRAADLRDDERAFLARQRLDENLRAARGNSLHHGYAITLDRAVNLPPGSVICSANRVGNGFIVKGCAFGDNRSRGILIKASRGEVSWNHLEGSWMPAILVSPEYWWLEAGSSSDLKIIGNTISNCRGTAISVEAAGGNGQTAPAGAHKNIVIADNTITACPLPNIHVTSAAGLQIESNIFRLNNVSAAASPLPQPVKTENCENIIIANNQAR